jgi:hypothetical protein
MRIALAALIAVAGCARPPAPPPEEGRYRDDRMWLCVPGREDACAGDLTATAIHPDGTRTIEPFVPAADPQVDCFYVYPTVDMGLVPGNHESFEDLAPMTRAVRSQAARFREACALWAPLYRQVTIGTYLQAPDEQERRLASAFADVEAAFAEYLAHRDRGRPIVLVGHSQGAEMIVRLLRRFFDEPSSPLRERLLVALAIGGHVEVPRGASTGGTLRTIPVCTSPDERGCVIAYRTHAAGREVVAGRNAPKQPGGTTVCVNPSSAPDGVMSRSYFPIDDLTRRRLRGVDGVTTPFVVLHDFYTGRCAEAEGGYRYLAVSMPARPGDARTSPVDFGHVPLEKQLGLHLVDLQLPQGDLVDRVARRARRP